MCNMEKIKTFGPGENLNCLGIKRSAYILQKKKREVHFPSRIHISPLDCTRFSFSGPSAGGLGFSISLMGSIKYEHSASLLIKSSMPKYERLMKHYVLLFEKITTRKVNYTFSLDMPKIITEHFGLGSSVCVATGIMWALNDIFDCPLNPDQIRELIARNFVEVCGDKLSNGLETGVGTSVLIGGGFTVVTDQLYEVYKSDFPQGYKVILINPLVDRPDMDKPESQDMLKRTYCLDLSYKYIRVFNVFMDLIPYFEKQNLKEVGNLIWDMQFSGTHLSMIQSYSDFGSKIYRILCRLRYLNCEMCGISSVGPAIYCVCKEGKADHIHDELLKEFDKLYVIDVKPDNKGIYITD